MHPTRDTLLVIKRNLVGGRVMPGVMLLLLKSRCKGFISYTSCDKSFAEIRGFRMANKNQGSEEIIQPPKPEKRRRLSESEISELEKSEKAEATEDVQGHVGLKEYYKAPQPLIYMPRTPDSDALVHDIETQKLIEDGLRDIENLREQMEKEKLEIERLKNETRVIIAKLLMA